MGKGDLESRKAKGTKQAPHSVVIHLRATVKVKPPQSALAVTFLRKRH